MINGASRRIVVRHLELTSRDQFRPSARGADDLEVRRVELPCPELNRFFYDAIGRPYQWLDRLNWDEARWMAWLDRPELQTWIGYVAGTPVGYFEIEAQCGGSVEIAYFGLLPRFIGQGRGSRLLALAVEKAWDTGAARVWLHTCTLDHPNALKNYLSRGFRLFKEEVR